MNRVSLLKCSSYENRELKRVIFESLYNTGFDPGSFKNARVLVKPNLLMPAKAEKAIITHHEFFRAVVQIVKDHGGIPFLVESPAIHSLERVIRKTEYNDVLKNENIEIRDPHSVKTLSFDKGNSFKKFDISEAYFDADIILNLPKFKTHGFAYITGAVKLLFGAIPGLAKSKMHLKLPLHADFAGYLLDLYGAISYGFSPEKPVVHIMDAVMALEGEGPGTGGKPKMMGAVLAGRCGIAVDYVATRVAGLDHKKAISITEGFKREFGVSSPEKIEIIGESIEKMRLDDFQAVSGNSILANNEERRFLTRTFRNLFVEKPVPEKGECTLCYQCRKICPAGVISGGEKKEVPLYNYNLCIRCYCCLEICPEAAIKKRRGPLQWLLPLFAD